MSRCRPYVNAFLVTGRERGYGEVEIAKRIEQGQLTVVKVMSRSPVIVPEIIRLGEQLKSDPGMIKDILRSSDEELTEENIGKKHQETLHHLGEIDKTYK